MPELSKMQQRIYAYLVDCIEKQGYPPSVREIGEAVGLKSPSTVHFHLKRLEEAGIIEKGAGKGRAITLRESPRREDQVPVVGNVAAGSPILAEECIEDYLTFDTGGRTGEYFALRVRGESMINAGILPGDLVVVHQGPAANHGDIVVAMIDGEATVKRLSLKNGQVWLMPENEAYSPIDGTYAQILGRVAAVVRRYGTRRGPEGDPFGHFSAPPHLRRVLLLELPPQLFQGPLFDAGDVAAGDAEGSGDFPLGQGDCPAQPVPQPNDLRFPGGQTVPHQLPEAEGAVPVVDVVQHGVIHPYHVQQFQGVSLFVRVDGVGEGDLSLCFFLAAEVHEDLVFDALGGIGGQPGALFRLEAGDALDEADGADGDQILLVGVLGVVLFHDVGHQPQVPLDQDVPGRLVPGGVAPEILPFLRRGQRLGKGAAPGQPQGKEQGVGQEKKSRRYHKIPPGHFYAGEGSPHAAGQWQTPGEPTERRREMGYVVYLLRCGDGSLYTGCTNDLPRRLEAHQSGRGAKYTRSRLPVELVYWEPASDRSGALRREAAIKRMARREKLALIQQGSPPVPEGPAGEK